MSSVQRKQGRGVTDGQRRSSGVTAAAGLGDDGRRSGGARVSRASDPAGVKELRAAGLAGVGDEAQESRG